MKKTISLILSVLTMLLMLVCALPTTAFATYTQGEYTFEIFDQGAEITGYSGTAATLVIPEYLSDGTTDYPVVALADEVFSGKSPTSVTLPSSLVSIGNECFSGCQSLISIFFGNKLESIGISAFFHCINLTEITLPESMKTLGVGAFLDCEKIETVTLNGVTTIGNSAFENCAALKVVAINEGTKSIGTRAFAGCDSLEIISLPNSVTTISDTAFDVVFSSDYCCYTNSAAHSFALQKNINFTPYQLYSISVTPPTDTVFYTGESFSSDGFIVTASYINAAPRDITAYSTFSSPVFGEYGNYNVTVEYGEYGVTLSERCVVSYAEDFLTGITVTPPTKTVYIISQQLDTAGMTVTATYASGKTSDVTASCSVAPLQFSTAGIQTVTVICENKSASFTVTVVEDYVESITVTPPTKTEYFVSQQLNTAGMTVTATYASGKTSDVTANCSVAPLQLATAGTQTVTVSYEGKSASFTVTVVEDVVESITVTPPTKTEYFVSQTLNTAGMTVTATYASGKTSDVTANCSVAPLQLATAGTQTVTVSYENKSASFTVTVKEDVVESITATPPTKTGYFVSQTLDTAGMTVTATYASGKTSDVTANCSVTPLQLATAGIQTVTVRYEGKSASFTVTVVEDYVESITVTPPTKTEYFVSQQLNTAGMTVTATYASGKTSDVTASCSVAPQQLATAGIQTVTVSYENKSASFTITVKENSVESISIVTPPTTRNYDFKQGGNASLSGMVLKARYADGTEKTVTDMSAVSASRLDTQKRGTQTITVTYENCSATFDVTVSLTVLQWIIVILLFGWIWYL